ncbi:MAG: hypothetical protein U0R77_07470 [Mycolicibacterium insubricum]|jgi:hypothetical protein|uniref:hypothetical protein n=1 Tax=Mycolicibacterium insubricum TaxID=444597 RepID=UPI00138DB50F|nr:hypothetical protein [Mycolicibacterium insubricum]BBZ67190.1 hypothetical protein MINS_26190 [Mycolicibacterium insubricum]
MARERFVSRTPQILAAATGVEDIGHKYVQAILSTAEKADALGRPWGDGADGQPMEQNYLPQEKTLIETAHSQAEAVKGLGTSMRDFAKKMDDISRST